MNSRLTKLRKLLLKEQLDAVLISNLANITYLTDFSGFFIEDRDAYLLIAKKKQYIFTHGIYKEVVQKSIKNFEFIQIQRENPISIAIKKIVSEEKIKRLGFETFDLKVNEYERLIQTLDKNILQQSYIVNQLRIIKSSDEIAAIRKACQLGNKAYSHILKNLRSGVTEKELAFELEFFIKKHGADISFPPIVAFGPNASKPHHQPTNTKLKQNSLVLVDFGVLLDNYCSDMARTLFFSKASAKQKKVYQTVLTAQQKATEFIENKLRKHQMIKAVEVDKIARDYIIEQGYESMPHSLGHGIGLEVHESPRLTVVSEENLESGMVFSIEPGIYLPGEFGIRIEDIFAIENNKLIQLTNAPKALTELKTA